MSMLIIYALVLIGMGLWDRRTGRQFEEYVLTGRRNGTVLVTSGLLATVLGASATMGVIQLAWQVGFPAFWWLGVGAIGFVIQSIFLSKKLFQFKVFKNLAKIRHLFFSFSRLYDTEPFASRSLYRMPKRGAAFRAPCCAVRAFREIGVFS